MLKIDQTSKKLVPVSSTSLKQSNILEREDLQKAIVQSWDAFCHEMGYEELFFVGSEITPHDSCRDRIDILGVSRDGTPVVFELKRHRDRLQLLQAISYAAMVAKWNTKRFLKELVYKSDDETEELQSLLSDPDFELEDPEIVLIAEAFDPEVILAADWLSDFGVPISAFTITAVEYRDDVLISLDQKFPLPGVDDVYVRRTKRSSGSDKSTSWQEALKNLTFPFAERAYTTFRRHSEGNPSRRSFHSMYSGSPLGRMGINFRRKYLKVYTVDQSPEAEQELRKRFGGLIEFTTWGNESTNNSGFTFTIETEEQFERFLQAVEDTSA